MDYDRVEELEKKVESLTKQLENNDEAIDVLFEIGKLQIVTTVEIFESLISRFDDARFEKETRESLERMIDALNDMAVKAMMKKITKTLL